MLRAIAFFLVLFVNSPVIAQDSFQSYWEIWRQEYNNSLTGKDGWLRLAGLYWLQPGNNTLGSAAHNMHRFPARAPSELGSITIDKDKVVFQAKYSNTLIDNQRANSGILSVENETRVNFDSYEFFVLQREGNYAVRLIDNALKFPQKDNIAQFMPFEKSLIVYAKLIPHKQPQTINIATVYGTNRQEKSAGWLEFEIAGVKHRIQAVDYGRDTPLYLFFADSTNGETTYDAGRYLKVGWPNEEGITIIDFNRSYNPPCAYTPYATCPLTPPQNRLNIAINAGELNFVKSH